MTTKPAHQYLALLRGINVGGKALIKMADLKAALEHKGFEDVRTYIQSGNVLFTSDKHDKETLAVIIHDALKDHFNLDIDVVVLSAKEWNEIIESAPSWWGHDNTRKHNLVIMIPPYDMNQTMAAIGELKPDIESAEAGNGVVYQSISLEFFGRTTSGKLAANPIYKHMTIRNYNTAQKLNTLLTK